MHKTASRSNESEVAVKYSLVVFIIVISLLVSISGYTAGLPGSLGEGDGVNNNPHNLSSQSGNTVKATDETQICVFCHTPHGATPKSSLWNRLAPVGSFLTRSDLDPGISNSSIIGTTLYDGNPANYPNGASKLCLSCHDGVTAIGELANGDIFDMTIATLGSRPSEIDLTKSHPISFVYNTTVRDYLNTIVPGSYQLTAGAYLETDTAGKTWVQCTICHQPHQDTRDGGTNFPFWRIGTGNPATDYDPVCQSCHTATPGIADEHNF